MKNVFFLIKKALFILEIFNFLYFFPFLSMVSRFKRSNVGGIYMMSSIDLHKFTDVIFGITQKLLYITSSNLVR